MLLILMVLVFIKDIIQKSSVINQFFRQPNRKREKKEKIDRIKKQRKRYQEMKTISFLSLQQTLRKEVKKQKKQAITRANDAAICKH